MAEELSQEDIFSNDIDPLDAIRDLRREEGVAEEDLPIDEEPSTVAQQPETEDDTDAFEEDEEPAAKAADEPDEDPEQLPGEDQEDSGEDKGTEEEVPLTSRKFRANGQEFSFTQDEMLAQFETVFGQSMDYTQKMQKIAPYRKMISALETEGITQEQLNVAIDALKGDKGALQTILKTHDIDNYDLAPDDEASPYTPREYGKNEIQMGIEEVTSKIQNDEEYKITVNVIDEQWDSNSRQTMASNPAMIQGLHNDIRNGIYDKVAPAAMKMKVLDGNTKSDIEYYMLAGEQMRLQQEAANNSQSVDGLNKPTQDAEDKFGEASSEAKKKRAASSTRGRSDRKGVIDYLDDNDEAYNDWYNKLQSSN